MGRDVTSKPMEEALSAKTAAVGQDDSEHEEDIWQYLRARGVPQAEGSSTEAQVEYLMKLAANPDVLTIGEVGFNAGVSSDGFLRANTKAHVTSFDLGVHPHVGISKAFIDERFPGRHTLVLGDSNQTVPRFKARTPSVRFDLVFVDGGHDYDTASNDLRNFRSLSHSETAVVMDDLLPWETYGEGPTRAWEDAVRDGVVIQFELVQDGTVVERIEPPAARAWALGRYVF